MKWMTMTSVVPCHALHAPQHAAASPFGPLNHSNDFLCPSCRSRLYITGTGKSRCRFLYARLKNGTYYVTGYGVRLSVNFFVSG